MPTPDRVSGHQLSVAGLRLGDADEEREKGLLCSTYSVDSGRVGCRRRLAGAEVVVPRRFGRLEHEPAGLIVCQVSAGVSTQPAPAFPPRSLPAQTLR